MLLLAVRLRSQTAASSTGRRLRLRRSWTAAPRLATSTNGARLGGSENYVVTREFRQIATPVQRAKLLECLFAVAASDGEISVTESHEVLAIAEELGFTRPQALGVRAGFREHLAELRRNG